MIWEILRAVFAFIGAACLSVASIVSDRSIGALQRRVQELKERGR